jgi:peptide/nickel transport system substrate-binding protein
MSRSVPGGGWRVLFFFFTVLVVAGASGQEEPLTAERTFTYGEFRLPTSLEPITSNNPVSVRLSELLFDGLIRFNEKGEVEGALAESWEVSPNGMLYTFVLRENALWHDGRPVTAQDVKFTFDLIMHPRTPTALKKNLDFIAGARALDDRRIRFSLKHVVYNALGRFNFKILPQHHFVHRYLTREDPFCWNPVGSGPYRFVRVSDEGWVELEAFPGYYAGPPQIERIVMRHFLDRNLMTEALLTGAIDAIVSVQPSDIGRIKEAGQFYLKDYNSLSYSFFAYNVRRFHLKDARVRRALSMGVNVKKMLLTFFQGKGKLVSGPFAPGSYSYNASVKPLPYSPWQAKKLLRQAGYRDTDRDGIVEKNGMPLRLVLKASIADSTMKEVCVAYQDYLREIGVDVKLQFLDRYAWEQAIFRDHDFDVTLGSWLFDDAADITSLFHSSARGPYQNNFIGYENPEVDRLLNEFAATTDSETRRTINHRLHEILAEECPYTFLWTLTSYAAFNNRIRGTAIDPYAFFSFIREWYIKEPASAAGR